MEINERYLELTNKYNKFLYDGFAVEETENEIEISYKFTIEGLDSFNTKWYIQKNSKKWLKNIKEELKNNLTLNKLIFSLGMIELISYWKLTCAKEIVIAYKDSENLIKKEELDWWREQYYYGLGEFFYTNRIDVCKDDFVNIRILNNKSETELKKKPITEFSNKDGEQGFMIPIGGGKDSAVSLELLDDIDAKKYCFMINGRGATFETAKMAGYGSDRQIVVKRILDKKIIKLNGEGFLNGHTPFSAMAAFSSVLVAYLYGLNYVVLSNEATASESTVKNTTINHQYSKSLKFERDFFEYERQYIGSGVYYFSLLRGWTEYRIAKYFSTKKKYHEIFRSCNVGSKEDRWCGQCAKCLFVCLMLSPFLEMNELTRIFNTNMLENQELIEIMDKLTGNTDEKPFECVGSVDEVNIAICKGIERLEQKKEPLPKLFSKYRAGIQYERYRGMDDRMLLDFCEDNNIPEFLIERVM